MNAALRSTADEVKFCLYCGGTMKCNFVEHENVSRMVCSTCGWVHYCNPVVLVGCLVAYESKLLLIRRGTEPQLGRWAIPTGFVETGETPEQAAAREVYEETSVKVNAQELNIFGVGYIHQMNQIYLFYRGVAASEKTMPTREASESVFVHERDMPWSEMAYPHVNRSLLQYFSDQSSNSFGVYQGEVMHDNFIISRRSDTQEEPQTQSHPALSNN